MQWGMASLHVVIVLFRPSIPFRDQACPDLRDRIRIDSDPAFALLLRRAEPLSVFAPTPSHHITLASPPSSLPSPFS
jgi:hypothetical protein